jgi:hypothetical protein
MAREICMECAVQTKKGRCPMNGCTIRTAGDRDRKPVIAIFNHYVTTGFAAYPDMPVPFGFFDLLRYILFTRYY